MHPCTCCGCLDNCAWAAGLQVKDVYLFNFDNPTYYVTITNVMQEKVCGVAVCTTAHC